jgi:hypothetical protein
MSVSNVRSVHNAAASSKVQSWSILRPTIVVREIETGGKTTTVLRFAVTGRNL